jgi:hypothetical protein
METTDVLQDPVTLTVLLCVGVTILAMFIYYQWLASQRDIDEALHSQIEKDFIRTKNAIRDTQNILDRLDQVSKFRARYDCYVSTEKIDYYVRQLQSIVNIKYENGN